MPIDELSMTESKIKHLEVYFVFKCDGIGQSNAECIFKTVQIAKVHNHARLALIGLSRTVS